jgi:hypothetical protein
VASDLERLVAELRAIAGEVERLRPQLVQHAGDVRRFAAEVAADPQEQTAPRGHAVSLLDLAGRQCDALAAELGYATQAADHFAQRVLSGGSGAEAGSAGGSGAAVAGDVADEPASDRGGSTPPPDGRDAAPPRDRDAPPSDRNAPRPREAGGGGSAQQPTSGDAKGLPPYVPWWIPNGAPWLGNRGIAPRRDADGNPPAQFALTDLSRPSASGTDRRGGHGGDDVPPSRVHVTDTSRDLVTAFVEAGYTSPNCLPQGLVDERSFWMDQAGHAARRHAEIPDSVLMRRALDGRDPITGTTTDWETGKTHRYGRDATTFVSKAAAVFAEAHIWHSQSGRTARAAAEQSGAPSFQVRFPAKDIFGARLSQHLNGWTLVGTRANPRGCAPIHFAADTVIVAVYRRSGTEWHPYTMYPKRP